MTRTRLLGALAVAVALVLGAFAYNGITSTKAAPTIPGPDITSSAPATAIVGSPFDVEVATDGTVANPYSGYNLGMVYSNASLTANPVGANNVVDQSTGTLWASTLIPAPANLTDNFGGLLVPPEVAVTFGVTSLSGGTSAVGNLVKVNFTGIAAGVTGLHKVTFADIGNDTLFGSYGTYTIDASASAPQLNTYSCSSVPSGSFPAGACGPLPVPGSTTADNVIVIQEPAPVLTISKTASAASVVAGGQSFSYTITVGNSGSSVIPATSVSVDDVLPAAIPIANVTLPVGCTNVGQDVTCTAASINPGSSVSFILNVSATDPNAGNTCPVNTATATDNQGLASPNSTPVSSSATVCIIPPAVAWSKSDTQDNLWLSSSNPACDPTNASGQCYGDQVNVFKFDEVMTNQGDPNGLGGFSFDLHYNPTQYQEPTIDMSPAVALFAASGRVLDCTVTIPQNGDIHEACASTGTIGVGPHWVGSQVMAHVTLTPQSQLVESIRPNKENGDISTVKDDQVTVTNTCGQPLNDGTIQPVPGQPECQGNLLQGVGPGGVLTGSPNGGESTQTIRRLEGDVTGDCSVTIADMQLEASKFGTSTGSLLYSLWYDVNSPLQQGDGEIDINDIQFVYGRFGSECSAPIPAQPSQPPLP